MLLVLSAAFMTLFSLVSAPASALSVFNNVTFCENVSSSCAISTFEQADTSAALTLFANLSISFSNPGYTFSDWNTAADGSGTAYADGEVYSFSANLTLFAQWVPNQVTFYENDSPTDAVTSVQKGTTSQPLTPLSSLSPTFSNPGYSFSGWNTASNGSGSSFADQATYDFVSGSVKLYAQWTPNQYTVTYDPAGGSVATTTAAFVTGGTPLVLPAPSRAGYLATGWFTAATGGSLVGAGGSSYAPVASLTLYAQWTPIQYTVTYDPNGGTSATMTASYSTGGASLTLPSPSRVGYATTGWYTAASGGTLVGAAGSSFAPGASMTLYAQWNPNQYTVTYAPSGGTLTTLSASYSTGDVALTLPTPTRAGYVVTGWYTAASGGTLVGTAGSSYAPAASVTLYAQWSPNVETLTLMSEGGTGVPSAVSFTTGATSLVLPVPVLDGYQFLGWFSAPTGGAPVSGVGASYTPTSSQTLYAQWAPGTYTVTLNPEKGTVSATTLHYTTGAPALSLPTPVLTGESFLGWFSTPSGGGLVGVGGSSLVTTSDVTLYAQWQSLPSFTVAFQSNGSPTSLAPLVGVIGDTATIPTSDALSQSGVTFGGWNTMPDGSGVTYQPGATLSPLGDTTLYAVWQALPTMTVSFNLNGAPGSMTSLHAAQGSVVSLPTSAGVARSGYRFTGWATGRSGGTRYSPGAHVSLNSSLALYAQWRAVGAHYALSQVGPFAAHAVSLSGAQLTQVSRLAERVLSQHVRRVVLYGYASSADGRALAASLSRARALAVAGVLQADLRAMHAPRIVVLARGEGAMSGRVGAPARLVEVLTT